MLDGDAGKILVVDDEAYVREIVSRTLSGEGFRCGQARNAAEARQYLSENEVHLVTLDVNMPGQSGLELLPEIRSRFPETEVLMLTARNEIETAIAALTQGAYGYLVKPVKLEELVLQVKRGLERRLFVIEKRLYTQRLEEKVREQTTAIRRAHEETILRLVNASMHRDKETGAHIKRVGLLSELLAQGIGWPCDRAELMRMAAPMHDVGKIGISDAILQKPGKLTAAEFEIMKTHTTVGAQMLANSESSLLQLAAVIAQCHHERWDGTGYPHGLVGVEIPDCARIVAVVDVYDALTHDRVYRPALLESEVLDMLRTGSGSQFDPALVATFIRQLPQVREILARHPDEVAAAGDLPIVIAPGAAWPLTCV